MTAELPLGEDLRAAREALGLSQDELGRRVGVSGTTIVNWEARKAHPTGPNAHALRRALLPPAETQDGTLDRVEQLIHGMEQQRADLDRMMQQQQDLGRLLEQQRADLDQLKDAFERELHDATRSRSEIEERMFRTLDRTLATLDAVAARAGLLPIDE